MEWGIALLLTYLLISSAPVRAGHYVELGVGPVGFNDASGAIGNINWLNPVLSGGTELYALPWHFKIEAGPTYRVDTGLKDGSSRGVGILAPQMRVNYDDRAILGLSWSPLVFFQDPSTGGAIPTRGSGGASAASVDLMWDAGPIFGKAVPWLRYVASTSATLLVGDQLSGDLFRGDPGRSLWVAYEARMLLKLSFGHAD
jgi:hypothetical protein